MPLIIYNTLTRKKEEFKPLVEGRVRMYVCGPTVYDYSHIGHAKTYVAFDTVVRYLRWRGFNVRYVQNITDVGHLLDSGEDRILKGAARERVEPMEIVEKYARAYFEDMDALGVQRPDISPRASAHVPEQIEMIKTLIEKGNAYEADGSVYFDVSSFKDYGKLSGRKVEELEEGTREQVRSDKRHPEDFALWKKAAPEHILRWASPWGWGFPGWHIECSAMSAKYLGETFDIHGGGVDNIFPHNECEVAQSEAANGQPFANYWMLTGSLTVEGVKMSKSLGNFVTVKDILKKYRPEAVRFFILTGHYRGPIDFSDEALEAASKGWERLAAPALTARQRLRAPGLAGETDSGVEAAIADARAAFVTAMDDDFNTAAALAGLFEFNKIVNTLLNADTSPARGSLEAIDAFYREVGGQVLGVIPEAASSSSDANAEREAGLIQFLIELRAEARKRKDFATGDAIRKRLAELGVTLEDGKDGTTWKI
ncbi:MAG: cysteine--tRNA ligase [Chloroflexi bacterium]|nr:cysteine--tRNA ligase [Chloroflexota bacterium]